ncbi:type VI secretion system membrane subunit TssM [Neisseria sp. Ec49-e6-T10]|uniref:type VI secretion system membrane subunit TssM n=1 Tax=Neisseria sp. Ec49-e6-T10 TaxID=3140744 RepID=UPI003EBAC3A7
MKLIINFLTSRGLWIFLGVIAIVLLIWFVGPLIAIGDYYPLRTVLARVITAIVLVFFWAGSFAFRKYREAKQNALLLAEIKSSTQAPIADKAEEKDDHLNQQFLEVVNLLKKMKFHKKGSSGLSRMMNGQYLYQMPWYLFIGASGAGKTFLLKNSGLNFPLAGQFGLSLSGIGGTKNCDWMFTDEAVLLDTAGRYVSQDTNKGKDEQEWGEFVSLLKKYRPKQPVNGVILTISIEDLLDPSKEHLKEQAVKARKRLQELRDETNISFPVYLMVTKLDLLTGFCDYFSGLTEEERKQVWGVTFPVQHDNKQQAFYSQRFGSEYELLTSQLNKRLPTVVQNIDDSSSRAQAYLFTQEFANLQNVLFSYLKEAFEISKYELNIDLRGIYFCSAHQTEQQQLGTVVAQIKNRFNLQDKHLFTKAKPIKEKKSFFVTDVFEEVVFPEANLAGINKKWFRTQRFLYWGGLGVLTLATFLFLFFMVNSYFYNKTYLSQVDQNAAIILNELKTQDAPPDLLEVLNILDRIKKLSVTREISDIHSSKWRYHFGLYQAKDMDQVVHATYQKILQDNVLPTVASEIEKSLRNAAEDDPEYAYEALKAYLMLYNQDKYDDRFIREWLLLNIKKKQNSSLSPEQIEALERHLKDLLEGKHLTSSFAYDEALVEKTRGVIARDPLSTRIYSKVKKILLASKEVESVSFFQMGGAQSPLVFRRESDKSLTDGIPGAFTSDGYWKLFSKTTLKEFKDLFQNEPWVLGKHASISSFKDKARVLKEVQMLYFNDYIETWNQYLSDLRVVRPRNLHESIQLTRLLSESRSPFVLMVEGISKNTHLELPVTKAIIQKVEKVVDGITDNSAIGQVFKKEQKPEQQAPENPFSSEPEKMVDQRFMSFYQLVHAQEGQAPPINDMLNSLNELYIYLVSVQVALDRGIDRPSEEALMRYKADIDRLPEPFRTQLNQFSSYAIDNAKMEAAQKLVETLNKGVKNIALNCNGLKTQGYPFVKDAKQDIALEEFAQIFGPTGEFSTYFDKNIKEYGLENEFFVENNTDARYLLDIFQNAKDIRKAYFQNNQPEPFVSFDIKVIKLDEKIDTVFFSIGEQSYRYEHGPQVPMSFQWPPKNKTAQVRLQLQPLQKGQKNALTFNGVWAIFRFFESAHISSGYSPNSIIASFDVSGRTVVFEVSSNSRNTPFLLDKLRQFKCS